MKSKHSSIGFGMTCLVRPLEAPVTARYVVLEVEPEGNQQSFGAKQAIVSKNRAPMIVIFSTFLRGLLL